MLDAYFINVYIIARMFRSFSNKAPSLLSLVYAGKAHILNLVQFFVSVLKVKPINKIEKGIDQEEYQCLYEQNFGKIFNISYL